MNHIDGVHQSKFALAYHGLSLANNNFMVDTKETIEVPLGMFEKDNYRSTAFRKMTLKIA